MKILFLIDNLKGGGAEKALTTLVNNLDKEKFDITVQTISNEGTRINDLNSNISYKSMNNAKTDIGRRLISIWLRLLAYLGMIYRFYIKDDYDIEVAYLECAPTKFLSFSTNKRAKKIAWVHCDLIKKFNGDENIINSLKKYYAKFDEVICVSEDVKISFDKCFGDVVNSRVLYNVFESENIISNSRESIEDIEKTRKTMIFLGRFSPQKRADRLLKVHKRIIDDGLEYDLWLLGEGALLPELKKYADDNNLNDTVHFLGFKTNPYPYLKEADVYVCSSDYEGFSTTVAEALIIGTPVVTTDCSGMRELLGNSEYGIITDNDEDSLYEGIKRILTDDKLRNSYKSKAIERGKYFSTESLTKATEDYFISLVRGKDD